MENAWFCPFLDFKVPKWTKKKKPLLTTKASLYLSPQWREYSLFSYPKKFLGKHQNTKQYYRDFSATAREFFSLVEEISDSRKSAKGIVESLLHHYAFFKRFSDISDGESHPQGVMIK